MEIKLAVTSIGIDFTCGNIVQLVKRKKIINPKNGKKIQKEIILESIKLKLDCVLRGDLNINYIRKRQP